MKRQRGSILIFTLWVLIILTILSIILSYRASTYVKLAKYESDKIKATYLARAGVIKMLAELAKDSNSYDSLNEDWNRDRGDPEEFKLGNGTVFYGASDESGRLNLNKATVEQLARLEIDNTVAQAMLEYKNDKVDTDKKEFEFMEELFLVEGMTREIYMQIKDTTTIHRGEDSKVNINTAPETVLYAVIGDQRLVHDVIEYRKGQDGEEGTEDDRIFGNASDISMIEGLDPAWFSVQTKVFRIWAQTSFSENEEIVKSVIAVVDRSSGKIYHWKEF